jgi:hypothetical protein
MGATKIITILVAPHRSVIQFRLTYPRQIQQRYSDSVFPSVGPTRNGRQPIAVHLSAVQSNWRDWSNPIVNDDFPIWNLTWNIWQIPRLLFLQHPIELFLFSRSSHYSPPSSGEESEAYPLVLILWWLILWWRTIRLWSILFTSAIF